MARTRSTTGDAGVEGSESMTAENKLMRQQIREMTQQLAALAEQVQQMRQQPATSVVVAQAHPPRPTAPATGPSIGDGDTTVAPPPTATLGVPSGQPTTPFIAPTPAVSEPTPGAVGGDPLGETVRAPTPVTSAAAVGEAAAPQTEREKVRANLAEFRKYDSSVFEGETTDPWVVEKWVDTMEKLFEDLITEDHERVPLAVHFLEGNTRMW